jgi:hypothetical protein
MALTEKQFDHPAARPRVDLRRRQKAPADQHAPAQIIRVFV